jgi:flagellar P-ring protein FlgI
MRLALIPMLICLGAGIAQATPSRIKDITFIQGVRDNQLVGYGLVVGLQGTGDGLRNSPFTDQSIRSMLDRLGVNIAAGSVRSKNVAAVVVTAALPPFVGRGERIDVTVSSIGDASSLTGGQLVMTPLVAADGQAYAVAQGPLAVTGFSASGAAEKLSQGIPTTGRIANGALIERELQGDFNALATLTLQIRNPDFSTAVAMSDRINAYAKKRFNQVVATARDFRTIEVQRPKQITASRLAAEIGELEVEPDAPARIVIDEKTGTIVIGRQVKLSTVAVTHGNLTVRITESPAVSQPPPESNGDTVVVPSTSITAKQTGGNVAIIDGPSLQGLVEGLNQIGLKPNGIIAILQAIKTAGALQGDVVVQ